MTDKPTPKQIQRACDLLNAASGIPNNYNPRHYGVNPAFTTLADTIAQLDAMQAELEKTVKWAVKRNQQADSYAARLTDMQAEHDKARADLGEIAAITGSQVKGDPVNSAIYAIAAPYRVETDPLTAALRHAFGAAAPEFVEAARDHLKNAGYVVAKRGLEIGRSA